MHIICLNSLNQRPSHYVKPVIAAYCNFWMSAAVSLVCFVTMLSLPAQHLFAGFQQSEPNFNPALSERERRKANRLSWVFVNPGGMRSALLPARRRFCRSPHAVNRPVQRDPKQVTGFFHMYRSKKVSFNWDLFWRVSSPLLHFTLICTHPAAADFESRGGVLQALIPWWDEDEHTLGMSRDSGPRWPMTLCIWKVSLGGSIRGRPVCSSL